MAKVGRGRPTKYSEGLADKICHAIATSSKGLRKVCAENEDFPHRDTIFAWLLEKKDFSDQYARARRLQVDVFIDDLIEISDSCNREDVQVARLQTDIRKWIACKLVPKVYGDKYNEANKQEDAVVTLKELE